MISICINNIIKNGFVLFTFLTVTFNICFAQVTFQKSFGGTDLDCGYAVRQTFEGGYIITGATRSFGGGAYDIYIIKTNSYGDTLWTKTFGGSFDDRGLAVAQAPDSGFIIIGHLTNIGSNSSMVCLIKLSYYGNVLWAKSYGGVGYNGSGNSIQQTSDGGFIIGGGIKGYGAGNYDAYLIKIDPMGNVQWSKTYGGIYNEGVSAIQQTKDRGYIFVGSTTTFTASYTDIYLVKTDSVGNLLWSKAFGGWGYDDAYSVMETANGEYSVFGTTSSFSNVSGFVNIYIIKTDSLGSMIWSKLYGAAQKHIYGTKVCKAPSGDYLISGYNYSDDDAALIRLDSAYNVVYAKILGVNIGTETLLDCDLTSDGGLIMTGFTYGIGTAGMNLYLVKTANNGTSGCNEGSIQLSINTAPTMITPTSTIVNSPTTIVSSPIYLVGSGALISSSCISVGVIDTGTIADVFNIFPNPTLGKFTISFNKKITKGNIKVFNLLGDNIFEESISEEMQKEIQLKGISPGIYFVKVFDGAHEICAKVIVE